MIQETTEKIVQIKNRLLIARSSQKSYADRRTKPLEFKVGDMVLLKVSPWKGVVRFGKREKLSPCYIRPFKILARVGPVAYTLELPEELKGIHCTFHVLNLKKCLAEGDIVVLMDDIQLDDKLHMIEEPVEIVDREVKRLKQTRRRGKVYNWETATYGKTWDNEDVHDLGFFESEFPAIVFNDTLTSEATLSCEPTVSSLNNDEIDFRISFDESDDEDCTVIFDKNSFSYKIISVNDLKTDLENDNDKVNMPSLPSPEPTVSYFHDLDYFKDFEKEFPTIVYNDAQTSKLDFLTEPTLSPQHINEFDLKDETSLSECDEEEQNVLYFNDLFSFNVIYPDDSKTDKDNDDDKIDIKHSSRDMSVISLSNVINTDVGAYAHGSNKLLETSETQLICAWLLEVDSRSVTSYRIIARVPTLHSGKLVGFSNAEEPIIELDNLGNQTDYSLLKFNPIHGEFQNLGIEGNGDSFCIRPYKELLLLLTHTSDHFLLILFP
ncbi:hypothetical protein Tco_0588776 [Tanacetum coccineum]